MTGSLSRASAGYLMALVVVADVGAFSNNAAPRFAPQEVFAAGNGPRTVLAADINGDGNQDVILINGDALNTSVLLNTTAGVRLSFASERTFDTTVQGFHGAIVDINGDGRPDVVVTDVRGYYVAVMVNTTTRGAEVPTFAEPQKTIAGMRPDDVAVLDVNQDGKPDVVVTDVGTGAVGTGAMQVLLNTTVTGTTGASFAPPQSALPDYFSASAISAADVNRDGKPDLIAAIGDGTLVVLLNISPQRSTVPRFAPAQTFEIGTYASTIVVGDINGDGRPDIAVACDGAISVLINITETSGSTAAFAQQQVFSAAYGPMTAADINQDGKPDLITANYFHGGVSAFVNTTDTGAATATFVAQDIGQTGINPSALTAAYFNSDEKPDIVVANYGDNTVSVLLNTTPQRRHAHSPWP